MHNTATTEAAAAPPTSAHTYSISPHRETFLRDLLLSFEYSNTLCLDLFYFERNLSLLFSFHFFGQASLDKPSDNADEHPQRVRECVRAKKTKTRRMLR